VILGSRLYWNWFIIFAAIFFLTINNPPLSHGSIACMPSKFFKTYKSTLIKLILIVLFVGIVVEYKNYKRKLFKKLDVIERKLEHIQSMTVKNNFIGTGYKIDNLVNFRKRLENSFFFVGHIYPQSEYVDPIDTKYRNIEHPLRYLLEIAEKNSSLKIIFGGDNVQNPTSGALKFLLDLKSRFAGFRFVLGNHDRYWKLYDKETRVKEIYPQRYFFEDENNIRFIYLHTVLKNGREGLDEEQVEFLKESLEPSSLYRYALVFMHHKLWLGGRVGQVYTESSRLIAQWKNDILPIITNGLVKGVFAGDGGDAPGTYNLINGIPHFSTGWSWDRNDLPPEWLRIDLKKEGVEIFWQKLSGGNLFVKKQLER